MNMRRNLFKQDIEAMKENSNAPMTEITNKNFDFRINPRRSAYSYPIEIASPNFFQKIFPNFKIISFSFFIFIVNILVFILEVIVNENFYSNMNCTLFRMGAKYTPAIKHDFEIFRLLSPIVLHANIPHLISNSLSILLLGFYVESLIGTFKYMFLYILSGVCSQLVSSILYSKNISVGASGSIMGVSAFFIFYFYLNYRDISEIGKKLFYYFIVVTVMNLLQPFSTSAGKIDIFSHIGGFISGFMIGISIINYENIKYDDQVNFIKKLKYICLFALISTTGACVVFLFYVIPVETNLLKRVCSNFIHTLE